MSKIRKNDLVVVLAGKDRGRSGKLIKVLDNDKALVEGINMIKKHVKPNPQKREQGGIIQKESPIHISNIAIMNPATKKADRVGFKTIEGSKDQKKKKVRFFKSNNELVDVA